MQWRRRRLGVPLTWGQTRVPVLSSSQFVLRSDDTICKGGRRGPLVTG